jgi:lipooligosaccharide transport system permease protein
MGFGVGQFVKSIEGLSYLQFKAPALVAITTMNSSFFECTYGSFVRMYYQKTFDGIIATPIALLILPIAFFAGLMFSVIAMCFTSLAPNIDFFNYPAFLFITPMFLLSGTFF